MATTLEMWFDLRTPKWAQQPVRETYAACLDMCEWGDALGFQAITLGEHHQTEDNYLASPIQMAGIIGGRTRKLQLRMIILTPFYNPLRLAEDLAVLNLATKGRAIPVLSAGYVPAEFDFYGVLRKDRAAAVEEAVDVCRKAWSGQPFSYRGRLIEVVSPISDPVPRLLMGASFPKMIRKAAEIADGLSPAESKLYDLFREERLKLGKSDPGPFPKQTPAFLYITEDPKRAWDVVGPHWLHTTQSYMKLAQQADQKRVNDKFPIVNSVEDLKSSPGYRVMTPEQCLQMVEEMGDDTQFHFNPMQGGLHPDAAWESLKLFERKVLPHLKTEFRDNLLY
jgi:alkanesulfonate monooxygenase SsuD/methylene tetrahydromethanopterin reductase-like flavin-dependent oxidoreductase (luciferase family)